MDFLRKHAKFVQKLVTSKISTIKNWRTQVLLSFSLVPKCRKIG